jgi:L-ascorbate metabolism protein UlaG (beta-lactamase superfamily)
MQLQLIRNATLLLDYAGHHILIDPYLSPRHSLPSYTGKSPNPMVDLPLSTDDILRGVELVIVSHLHSDHFDKVAHELVPKDLPLLCQPGNEDNIREKGFRNVTPITDATTWGGITITRTDGHHGTGEVEGIMGRVSGFVFQAQNEPTLYWAGDTIFCAEVQAAIQRFDPAIIVTHSCGATWPDSQGQRSLIVMDAAQTIEVCNSAPTARVIATHMETLDHATVSRADLHTAAAQANLDTSRLLIPADGESMVF